MITSLFTHNEYSKKKKKKKKEKILLAQFEFIASVIHILWKFFLVHGNKSLDIPFEKLDTISGGNCRNHETWWLREKKPKILQYVQRLKEETREGLAIFLFLFFLFFFFGFLLYKVRPVICLHI